jgi:hypothetical protein
LALKEGRKRQGEGSPGFVGEKVGRLLFAVVEKLVQGGEFTSSNVRMEREFVQRGADNAPVEPVAVALKLTG